jgi:G3E family GTPase
MVWAPESHFGRHIPFSLLTGFLGSGKTTLLNWMLRDPSLADTAIAVNEFGAIPLDHAFIESATDDVIVLPNGCMCCLATDDLEASLASIFARRLCDGLPEFRRLLIETSGLADPEIVLRSILESPVTSRFLWLDRVVATVDAIYGLEQLARHAEAYKQAMLADVIVITKSDLVDPGHLQALQAELARINPRAPRHLRQDPGLTVGSIVSEAFLDDGGSASLVGTWVQRDKRLSAVGAGCEPGDAGGGDAGPHQGHRHHPAACATTLVATAPIPWREFHLWLGRWQRELGQRLLRVKAILQVEGSADPVVIHAVQSTLHVPVSLREWPDGEQRTRIVFILSEDCTDELERSWDAFLASARGPGRLEPHEQLA